MCFVDYWLYWHYMLPHTFSRGGGREGFFCHVLTCSMRRSTYFLDMIKHNFGSNGGVNAFPHLLTCSMQRSTIFPECVARVPVSLWGSGGWAVFARRLPKTSATIRSRLQLFAWGPYGRAHGKFCKRGHFWRSPASHSFISRGKRGTLWHSNMFSWTCEKVVLRGRRNAFAMFFRSCVCIFSWHAQHFEDLRSEWWQGSNCVADVAFFDTWWQLMEALAWKRPIFDVGSQENA